MSQIDESAWVPDDETPGQVALILEQEGLFAGLWRSGGADLDPFDVPLKFHETIYVLAGSGQLRVDDGPPIDLAPGVTLTIPKGSVTHWSVAPDFVELWIYH
jgi:uncharacterized cupin superfamily protein